MKKTQPKPKAPWTTMRGGRKPNGHGRAKPAKPPTKRRAPVKQVSQGRAAALREYNREATKWKRGRLCECAGISVFDNGMTVYVCAGRPHLCTDVHHKKGRLGKLLMDKRFWMAVCPAAHRWIDANRKEAYSCGWLLHGWNFSPRHTPQSK